MFHRDERIRILKGFSSTRGTTIWIVALGLLPLAACNGQGDGSSQGDQEGMPAAAQPMSAEVQSFVSQGNDAQRSGEYEAALGFYRSGMELAPEHPVPQFGALMAAMALGEEALADSLSQRLAVTSPELLAMLNPDGSMGGAMPANPHAGGMPGGMPDMAPPAGTSGEVEGLPPGHPVLYEVTPDTVRPDTTGVR
jgi:hypothetical protein